jgi:hypothetical protein
MFFLLFFLMTEDPEPETDPNPYLLLMDPDPAGPKI